MLALPIPILYLLLSFQPPSLPFQTRMMVLQPSPEAKYRSLYEAFSKIIKTEHTRALFRGIGVVAGGAGPAHALYFSCYEVTKKYLTKANTRSTVLAQGVCNVRAFVVLDYCSL